MYVMRPVPATCAVSPSSGSPSQRGGVRRCRLPGHPPYLAAKAKGDSSMVGKQEPPEDAYGGVLQDPRDMVKAGLLEAQSPAMQIHVPCNSVWGRATRIARQGSRRANPPPGGRWRMTPLK